MYSIKKIKNEFNKRGGIMKTSELNALGINYRQIQRLLDEQIVEKIKHGYYILYNSFPREEVIIARMFPDAVIYLESALFYYEYTDRVPNSWQITVNKHSYPKQYNISYMKIKPYFIKEDYRKIGINNILIDNVEVKIYDKNKTICDVLRYENKVDNELFTSAIKNYIKDNEKDIRTLMEYGDILNVSNKIQKYIVMWI